MSYLSVSLFPVLQTVDHTSFYTSNTHVQFNWPHVADKWHLTANSSPEFSTESHIFSADTSPYTLPMVQHPFSH